MKVARYGAECEAALEQRRHSLGEALEARCFARRHDGSAGLVEHLDHVRMLGVANMSHVRREIVGADQHPVEAVDLAVVGDVTHSLRRLELNADAEGLLVAAEIARIAPPLVRARASRKATDALV